MTYTLKMQLSALAGSLGGVLPEFVLVGTFCLMLFAELVMGKKVK